MVNFHICICICIATKESLHPPDQIPTEYQQRNINAGTGSRNFDYRRRVGTSSNFTQ